MKVKNLVIKGLTFAMVVLLAGIIIPLYAQLPHEEKKDTIFQELPQEQKQVAIQYDDEIEKYEIPEAISSSVEESFGDYKITNVYRGSDGSYKVVLKKGDEKLAAFYDARGDFSRLEEIKGEDKENINDDWR